MLAGLLSVPFEICAQQGAIQPSEAMDLAATHNAAIQAFNRSDWAAAIDGLEKVIKAIVDPVEQAKIAPIYYTLGAAYFNAKNYGKAAETFRTYLTKYPGAQRVGEARLALARALFLQKNYAEALPLLSQLEAVQALREEVLLAQAECLKEMGKPDERIRVLEKLVAPEIRTTAQASGAATLAEVYLEKKDTAKVLELVNKLYSGVSLVDNVVAINALTIKLADQLAESRSYPQALAAYRAVRSRAQVIEFQNVRIAAMDRRMQANVEAARGNPQAMLAVNGSNNEIKAQQDHAKALLGEFEKLPDYGAPMAFRVAKVWYDWGKKWEAIVAFEQLLADYPEAKEREPALYSMVVCYGDLNRVQRTLALCDRYLGEFPKGLNAPTVGYMKGAAALESGDPKSAVTFFGIALKEQPQSQFREQMQFLLGNAHFVQGQYEEAHLQYARYLKDFPQGGLAEEAMYRAALTNLFLGDYEKALGALNAYRHKYPKGAFAADAGYRVMVCKYAANLNDEVIADASAWQKEFPDDQIAGEVLSLLGDAFAGEMKTEEAAAAYTEAYKRASTDEVFNYALFEASKQLQKLGKWPEIAAMFEAFIREKPDHPTVVAAMFWIGKAKAREGKTEDAKTFLVEQLERYLNEPKREAVEQLLQQLAQLCSKRPRPAPGSTPATPPTAPVPLATGKLSAEATTPPSVSTPLPPSSYDAVAELKKQLAPLRIVADATGKARLLYAEAELAKLQKRDADVPGIYAEIVEKFAVTDLSPVLLALVGDYLLMNNQDHRAAAFYEQLCEAFPKSEYLDYADVGRGELAMKAKNYRRALELFSHAADEIPGSKVKEATLGKARALLELARYDEAHKLFEQVASVREWRGESTATALYYLGDVEARQGRWAEAIAYYQRVFVAYQKYQSWVGKAYVRSAEAFDKMGKRAEAVAHLKEMLRNEKLNGSPEMERAKRLLTEWGITV